MSNFNLDINKYIKEEKFCCAHALHVENLKKIIAYLSDYLQPLANSAFREFDNSHRARQEISNVREGILKLTKELRELRESLKK